MELGEGRLTLPSPVPITSPCSCTFFAVAVAVGETEQQRWRRNRRWRLIAFGGRCHLIVLPPKNSVFLTSQHVLVRGERRGEGVITTTFCPQQCPLCCRNWNQKLGGRGTEDCPGHGIISLLLGGRVMLAFESLLAEDLEPRFQFQDGEDSRLWIPSG